MLTALIFTAVLSGAAAPQACAIRSEPAAYTRIEVKDRGLVAAYFEPAGNGRHPAVLILGGSEGGTEGVRQLAKPFADQGFAVLALSYFAAPGLPPSAEDIPLEYFDTAIAWLAAQPKVNHIGVYGVSKGGEASLLVASRSKSIRAAASGVGSSVVWQGVNQTGGPATSTWSLGGKPVAYVPYDTTVRFDISRYFQSIYALYEGGLKRAGEFPQAAIPVELINGPVLLISGQKDAMWPASRMFDDVAARLKAKGFPYPVQHLSYPDAGHAAGGPPAWGCRTGAPTPPWGARPAETPTPDPTCGPSWCASSNRP